MDPGSNAPAVAAPHSPGGGSHTSSHGHDSSVEDKAHTFRKRRLSLNNLRQAAQEDAPAGAPTEDRPEVINQKDKDGDNADGDGDDDPFSFISEAPPQVAAAAPTGDAGSTGGDSMTVKSMASEEEKAHTFRKRRLSLTLKRATDDDDDDAEEVPPSSKRQRRNSEISAASSKLSHEELIAEQRLQSRTIHATELLTENTTATMTTATDHDDVSNDVDAANNTSAEIKRTLSSHVLYQQKSAPPQRPTLDTMIPPQDMPKWSRRQQQQDPRNHRTLPFPEDVVGTFSCHGVEPIYDHDDDDEDDEEDALLPCEERPTTAAKINQDRGGVSFPYGNCARTALFAVYDGHGQGGELVSQFCLHEIQRRLEEHPQFVTNIAQAFTDVFEQVNADLAKEPYIEPLYAGTTACVGLLRDSKLICANAGDSRAVCARRRDDNKDHTSSLVAIDLTQDQNPDLPTEQARIEAMGGFVSPPPEPGLSARVWLDPECTQIGLAMGRSLGDYAVKDVGVIAEPVVTVHDVELPRDEFVIFATDGVWEFVSSQLAVDVVAKVLADTNQNATQACQALIELAAERWHEEEGDYRDDITALVVRLPMLWKTTTASAIKQKE